MNLLRLLAPACVAMLLAACAAGPGGHTDHHAAGGMDMKAMCDMHRQEMAGKTAAEQQALMQEHMKSMSPDMRERMGRMHAQCR